MFKITNVKKKSLKLIGNLVEQNQRKIMDEKKCITYLFLAIMHIIV